MHDVHVFVLFCLVILCPWWEIWVALNGYGTAAAKAALLIFTAVSHFYVFKHWFGCHIPVFCIFNACMDVDVCDCTLRLHGHHKRVHREL